MIDSKKVRNKLASFGKIVDLNKIDSIVNSCDRQEIIETQKKRYSYKIWDKKSEINGHAAEEIIKNRQYDIDNAYIIYIDNNIVYFQDHNPNESGYIKMNEEEAKKCAEEFINKKIEESVDVIIFNRIVTELSVD